MKRRLKTAGRILVLVFCILAGCQRKGQGDLLLPVYESGLEERATELSGDAPEESPGNEGSMEPGTAGLVREYAGNMRSEENAGADKGQPAAKDKDLVVHICGAVSNPGVYTMEAGSRIYQAVGMAGGFSQDAAQDYLNQADVLVDGMKVYVPTNEEVEALGEENNWKDSGGIKTGNPQTGLEDSPLVNINTAGEELLCSLPGVGASKAKSIMAYREKNGPYQRIEDIMNVEGIKDGLFNKIKDSITVQ
ncbi:MAG: helix-hairpin-helix domain-containing protein [Lachnospiraceae bacterium]|nr:helix-hairpin-helix domain-containing protein [Lachnospiraceae bacterium]